MRRIQFSQCAVYVTRERLLFCTPGCNVIAIRTTNSVRVVYNELVRRGEVGTYVPGSGRTAAINTTDIKRALARTMSATR